MSFLKDDTNLLQNSVSACWTQLIGEAIGVQVRQIILPKGDTHDPTRSHVSHWNYGSSTIFQSHLYV